MKRVCISITVFFLAVLFLLGSGKFTIGKMTCMGNGHASYSLGNAKDCCEKKDAPHETLKRACCELITISYSLDDYNPSQKINVSPLHVDFYPLFPVACRLPLTIVSSNAIFAISDLPPPDIKDRLYSFRSLLL
jgi:hypothetical protein